MSDCLSVGLHAFTHKFTSIYIWTYMYTIWYVQSEKENLWSEKKSGIKRDFWTVKKGGSCKYFLSNSNDICLKRNKCVLSDLTIMFFYPSINILFGFCKIQLLTLQYRTSNFVKKKGMYKRYILDERYLIRNRIIRYRYLIFPDGEVMQSLCDSANLFFTCDTQLCYKL